MQWGLNENICVKTYQIRNQKERNREKEEKIAIQIESK
jgi:hypothetical protein